jgi:hypothetical protein
MPFSDALSDDMELGCEKTHPETGLESFLE